MIEKEKILLTVIIPVYNRTEYIDKCIESVRGQTYKNLEIILVDDGSTDGSGEICDAYAKKDMRITVIHKKNGGLVSARKSGVNEASGDVVAFVDSDDWIEPDMYEFMMAAYMDGRPDMVTSGMILDYGEWRETYLDGIEAGKYGKDAIYHKILPHVMYDEKTERRGITASLCNKLLDCSRLKNLMDTVDARLTLGEDRVVTYGLIGQADNITVLHGAWYHYVRHGDSMTHTYGFRVFEKIYRFQENLRNVFTDPETRRMMKNQMNDSVRELLGDAIKNLFGIDMSPVFFIFPYEHVPKGSKVILYGAGDVGCSYWKCIRQGEYAELVAWVDRRHAELQEAGLPVESLDRALCKEYDYIVIAVQGKELAEKIRSFLVEQGVMEEKIIWKQRRQGSRK